MGRDVGGRSSGGRRRRSTWAAWLAMTMVALTGASLAPLAAPTRVDAAYPGAAGLIAYQVRSSTDIDGTQVWVMQPDGSSKNQLTSLGSNFQPSWSPDGAKVAFSSDRDGNFEIYVMDADGGNQTRITNDGATDLFPAWSPDGTKIAWARFGGIDYDIWVMDADGANAVDLTNNLAYDAMPSWRPGTSTIAFETDRDGDREIYTIDANGTGLADLSNSHATADSDPNWSPDGARLAFVRSGDVWTMLANGTGATSLTTTHVDSMPAWSPDGMHIAYMSSRVGYNDDIFVMGANGALPTRLTSNGNSTLPEDWFPDWQPTPVAISPLAVAFGSAVVGYPSAGRAVTVSIGVDPATISAVTVDGPNAADFDLLGQTCTAALIPALGSCTASVRFDPLSHGVKAAHLTFAIDGIGSRTVSLSGTGRLVRWNTIRATGPNYTWNDGTGLARTVSSTTTYLHAIYVTDRIGGAWANDTTRRIGTYYVRSTNNGATWTAPKRLNPTTQHGGRAAIASSGAYVYTAWVSQTKWLAYSGTAPRVLYFRRNTNHGSSTSWGSTVRLTSTTGRVDFAKIAASGAYVYVAYTDSSTGAVKLAISANRGVSWKTVTVGTTARTSTSGRFGFPAVAAAGGNVGVSWISSGTGTLRARISTTHGSSWGTTATLGTTTTIPTIAAIGTRVGFAWTQGGVRIRIWNAGVWGAVIVPPPSDGYASEQQMGPAIALVGSTGIATAYTACIEDCAFTEPGIRVTGDLVLRMSLDGGATWVPSDVVAANVATRRMNDTPTLLWPTVKRPYVLWNGWTEYTTYYRLYLRTAI